MERQELNNMIWKALNCKFKKDAPEAFTAIKEAGYDIDKCGRGCFEIYNPKTKRRIYLYERRGWSRNYKMTISHGPYTKQTTDLTEAEARMKTTKFDFVGCLEKPMNQVWYDLVNGYNDYTMTAVKKYEAIKSKRRMAASYAEDIERTKKQLADLQEKLVWQTKMMTSYEQEAKELKNRYGLKR